MVSGAQSPRAPSGKIRGDEFGKKEIMKVDQLMINGPIRKLGSYNLKFGCKIICSRGKMPLNDH